MKTTYQPSGFSSFHRRLRQDWEERSLARQIRRLGKWYAPFHGDEVLQKLVHGIISECGISTFVETGTFVGDTTKYVASRYPQVKVLTCEINPRWSALAKRFCRGLDNIEFFDGQSPAFLERSYEMLRSTKTLFWLDAHWGENWPLFDETGIISTLPTYAVIIDDFEVPGKPAFPFETYKGVKNCFAIHRGVLGADCLVPDYDPDPSCEPAGYGVFFKGLDYSGVEMIGNLRRLSA